MLKSNKLSKNCFIISLTELTPEILEFGWNHPEPIFSVPLQASAKIVNSILQVNRAIADLISKDDLKSILNEFVILINEIVFDQIKTQLMISRQSGYEALSDELDYLLENFKEFFEDKNGISVELLKKNVAEIKNIKKMFLQN